MQIFVRGLEDCTYTLEVESSDTISKIKYKLYEKNRVSPTNQRLIFASKPLCDDDSTLVDYGILRSSTIHMVIRLTGGGGFGMSNQFQDVTKSVVMKEWNRNAPSWKRAVRGLNLEGEYWYC